MFGMEKQELVSTALSLVMIGLLPVHQILVAHFGNQEWLNMVIGLPIGVATVLNIEIVFYRFRSGKS
jgi:hypothetical protein